MGYVLLFIVVFVTVVLIKGSAEKKKRNRTDNGLIEVMVRNDDGTMSKQMIKPENIVSMSREPVTGETIGIEVQPQKTGKIAELNRKMEEKTAWLEADTKRMQAERARRKAAKQAEKQAKIEFKNRNK